MKKFVILATIIVVLLIPVYSARADDLPPEANIINFVGHQQTYNLSCESRSASDWAAYFGSDVSEKDILLHLGSSDNPEVGFVGRWNGTWGLIPPNDYGTHAAAISRVLREYGLPAVGKKEMTWDEARSEIAAGRPVIVWIIGGVWSGTPVEYTASDGETMTVAANEHTMTLIGYNQTRAFLMDSSSANTYSPSIENFLTSWGVLENQGVIYDPSLLGATATPTYSIQSTVETVPTQAPTQISQEYVVTRGEYLKGVADKFGISWEILAVVNQLEYPYALYDGEVLIIPPAQTATPLPIETPTVTPTVDNRPQPTQDVSSTGTGASLYTVQSGDRITTIASQFGLTWQELVETNGLSYPYFLDTGQYLIIPAAGSASPSSTPAQEDNETAAQTPTLDTYVVQTGDYLRGVANNFNVDWEELAWLNQLEWPYALHPGDVLIIPTN